jgi:hypothetical protein
MDKTTVIKEFKTIPGIGPSLAEDLWDLGFRSIQDLKHEKPEEMYKSLEEIRGGHQDRCVLYVFRCAVYYAVEKKHDPELLKWWNWKDLPNSKVKNKKSRSASLRRIKN